MQIHQIKLDFFLATLSYSDYNWLALINLLKGKLLFSSVEQVEVEVLVPNLKFRR